MNWQLAAAAALAGGIAMIAQPAQAQTDKMERTLASVRLNSMSRAVLAKFGNPNEIYIGDIGVRVPGTGAQGAASGGGEAGMMGSGGGPMMGGGGSSSMMGGMRGPGGMPGGMMGSGAPMMGAPMGGGGGSSSMMGGRAGMGAPMMGGMGSSGMGRPGMGAPMMGGMGSSAMGGRASGGGKMGAMGGGGNDGDGPAMGAPGGFGGGSSSMMGGGGGMMGSMGGGAASGFGQIESRAARQQEVTWVYNRMSKDAKGQNTAISYEFLISPSGNISQIRCLGYQSPLRPTRDTPGIATEKGIRLGSSYADVVRVYGQPESYEKAGNVLVLSYPKRHVQFQMINQKEQADPVKAAYRVIAITIATIEA